VDTALTELFSDLKASLKFSGAGKVKSKDSENGKSKVIYGVKKDWGEEDNKEKDWSKLSKVTSEMVSESSLINPNDVYQQFSSKSDCITRPKPCKNCNCGRAKELLENNNNENTDNTNIDTKNLPKSECGKCYLGDAFRCEGCPFRGMPAFKPGDKVSVSSLTKVSSVNTGGNMESENVEVKVSTEKKVKIDL